MSREGVPLISDPLFYAAAIPAIFLFAVAKGGFGGGLGVVSVPLMALVMSPVQAAGIMLPILCLMDLLALWAFRGKWVLPELRVMLPGALVGIGIGALLFGYMSPEIIKLIIGLIAVLFTVQFWLGKWIASHSGTRPLAMSWGVLGGSVGGFTSMVAHAGGPPVTMYLLRRPLDRTRFVATTTVFFAVVNYVKLVPYGWLGQLSPDNLLLSLILAPVAPVGVATGVWLHRRVSDRFFFAVAYVMLFVVGVKLIRDGLVGL